jgi:hypothetical protein
MRTLAYHLKVSPTLRYVDLCVHTRIHIRIHTDVFIRVYSRIHNHITCMITSVHSWALT